ncbi:hypothetical protein HKBW3S47_02377, partial [Candidatus Hakubella thermalkaliphila]
QYRFRKNILLSFHRPLNIPVQVGIVNCLSMMKQYYPLDFIFFLDPFPLSYSSVTLNLLIGLILDGIFDPFHSYFSTIRSLSDIKKILGKFHLHPLLRLMVRVRRFTKRSGAKSPARGVGRRKNNNGSTIHFTQSYHSEIS